MWRHGQSHGFAKCCLLGLVCLVPACRNETPELVQAPLHGEDAASAAGDAEGPSVWKAVTEPRLFEFPRDHGAHRDYRIEWWYYTGNLQAADGRRVGYQLTFFRTGVRRERENPSRWAVRDLYIAHFALVDDVTRRHVFFERTNRDAVGWAGAEERPGRIWNGNWQVTLQENGQRHLLEARQDGYRVRLQLDADGDPVLHGERGLSRKGSAVGNASYYYTFPRLATTGEVTIDGETIAVAGLSWMDHEFSSSFLEQNQQGWDWFSMQFDDGHSLMLYQMRGRDGTKDPQSSGTWMMPDGTSRILAAEDFTLQPMNVWTSASTSARYPVRWRVHVPSLELAVVVQAVVNQQEMDTHRSTGIVYWEGCVDIEGIRQGRPAPGRGYLEMTGYDDGQPAVRGERR